MLTFICQTVSKLIQKSVLTLAVLHLICHRESSGCYLWARTSIL